MQRSLANAFSILLIVGCSDGATSDALRARIDCAGNPDEPTVDCLVQHLSGRPPARVCWHLRYECHNRAIVTGGEFCVDVDPGRRARHRIPLSSLTRADACDLPTSSEIRDIRVARRWR
jgi:hypothetical protein